VQSGYVSLFSVGADPDNPDGVMVIAKVYPAMRAAAYLVALRMSQGNALIASTCSCTNGERFCSHCDAACELLVQVFTAPDSVKLVSIE